MAAQDDERERRLGLWDTVKGSGLGAISARYLRDLGVYGGAQGIWVDKTRTGNLAPDGVTVGLLHTGRHYPDDLGRVLINRQPNDLDAPTQRPLLGCRCRVRYFIFARA